MNDGRSVCVNSAYLHTSEGGILIELFPNAAPKAVKNFCTLAQRGYYNSIVFHRVVPGLLIQTGDPTGTGYGGESIWGHPFASEFSAELSHDRAYRVSMANFGPHTNGSQFFITLGPAPRLDGHYTVFGRVLKGMEVVDRIGLTPIDPETNRPLQDVRISKVTIRSMIYHSG